MKFYQQAGHMALGNRLRRLGEHFASDAKQVFALYDVAIDTRWFPVFFMLSETESSAITELAKAVGQSHPAVSQVVREMQKQQIVESKKSPEDGRIHQVALTPKGKAIAQRLSLQCQDADHVMQALLQEAGTDLWAALQAVEEVLEQQSYFERMKAQRKTRENTQVTVTAYEPQHQAAFRDLNLEWIEQYFEVETDDRAILDDPQAYIIDPGGYIALALDGQQVIGCCALIPTPAPERSSSNENHQSTSFELSKMAVTEQAKGKGVGYRLGKHILEHAKKLGAMRVHLVSHHRLESALALYKKLGFKRSVGQPSPCARCNVQMEHDLKNINSL
jgi:DNA-binding MarR family transcriptional regulator/N-acetylglutamate synthase-like GNAT family acetyltransferase